MYLNKNMLSIYNNHLIKLKNQKILEVKKKDAQNIINNSRLKHANREYIKN